MLKLNATRKTRLVAAAIAAGAALPLAGAAWAASQGHDGGHGRGHHAHGAGKDHHGDYRNCGHGGKRMGHRRGGDGMEQRVDGRMAFLKAELAITADQEDAWQALEAVMRESMEQRAGRMAERREQRAENGERARTPVPERLAGHVEAMESHLEQMRKMQEAVSGLYAVLTPEQQQEADDLLSRFGPRGRH